jgi:hypothetical protein
MVDLGDRVVMRPLPDEPVDELVAKYRDSAVTADEARRRERSTEVARERRKRR